MKWSTELIRNYNDDVKFRRDVKLRSVLGEKNRYPSELPYFGKSKLRSEYLFKYSESEVNELLKNDNDPYYLMSRGFDTFGVPLVLRDYQEDILSRLIDGEDNEMFCTSRQIGMTLLMRLYMVHCILKGKSVVVVNNQTGCKNSFDHFSEFLHNIPYYMQPVVKDVNVSNLSLTFWNSKVVFSNRVRGLEDVDVLIFEDAGYNSSFENQYTSVMPKRFLYPEDKKTIVQSCASPGSYFNKLYQGNLDLTQTIMFDVFNKNTYKWDVFDRGVNWKESTIKTLASVKSFLIEYECCMDDKRLDRSEKLGNILNK
jgi:hypothetical protein